VEIQYLAVLDAMGASSLETIALALGLDHRSVSREVEPLVVRHGLVKITPAGRKLTPAGKEWALRRKPADSGHRHDEV
jgi:Holliday junction resolvasome RuvABC ATP-dependent DNA helicase subunit